MDPLSISQAPREAPTRPALIADGRVWTFAELAARVAVVRSRLPAGARIALRATNRLETVVAILALLEEGRAFVPIHPRLTAAEAAPLVADSEAAALLEDHDLATLARGEASPLPDRVIDPAVELAMLYTSGTTGRPKGAMLPRSAFIAAALSSEQNLHWQERDRWLLCMPICHVGGLSILTRCLMARRCVVLLPRFDPEAVLAAIVREEVTLLSVVPTMLAALLESDRHNVLARLRAVLVGGAATPFPLLEESARRGIPALATYGLTEACSQVTVQRLLSPPVAERGSGVPLSGTEVAILGPGGEPLPLGAIGRIVVRGPTLMTGYWRQPPIGGVFDTGDLGSLDEEGRLHVASRRTDLIVTGGENVYPVEVEQLLVSAPGVRGALVFGSPDERWGQVVSAAIVGPVDEARLWEWLATRLAPHKRPRLLCVVESLPVTAAGKPDRARAAQLFRDVLRPWTRTATEGGPPAKAPLRSHL